MARSRRLTLVLLVLVAAAVAVPAPAHADEQRAHRGDVEAVFSFTRGSDELRYHDLRLRIARAGQTLVDGPVSAPGCEEPYCVPGGGLDGTSVRVRDLDGDGEPEVLLDLFTGGAHCCVKTRVYWFDGAGYRSLVHDFRDLGYRLRDLGGSTAPEFVSGDGRFGYLFASFASSVFPLQVWAFRHGALVDVTRRFPARVRADARHAWRLYRKARASGVYEPRGAIAAWAADRYLLGRRAATLRHLRALARSGALPGDMPRSQAAFVRRLDRTLRRLGYARRQPVRAV
jgi:hypothetical protein